MQTTNQLIASFVAHGKTFLSAFVAYALDATARKLTVNQAVTEILNHPDSNAPRWQEGEKGAGKKAGTVKSLKTIRTEFPKDWQERFPFAAMAQQYESLAGLYVQSEDKKLVRKSTKDENGNKVWNLVRKPTAKAKKGADQNTSEGTETGRAVPADVLTKDLQVLIDILRPSLTKETRDALATFAAKHDLKVTIPAIAV